MNELESLKNKIKYRSSYRGTKEMDILLTTFVSKVINLLSFDELKILDDFMNCDDEEISNFYSNGISIPSFNNKKILSLFREHKI
jgi:antitoxin CptB